MLSTEVVPQVYKVTCFFSYYMFDKEVIRELLGKKLTGRLRKDLDDVSEKTGVSLKSCRRQVRWSTDTFYMYRASDRMPW